ncbi:MAG: hypothetical protein WBV74_01155 [Pseudonocardiaceae bacterium]
MNTQARRRTTPRTTVQIDSYRKLVVMPLDVDHSHQAAANLDHLGQLRLNIPPARAVRVALPETPGIAANSSCVDSRRSGRSPSLDGDQALGQAL